MVSKNALELNSPVSVLPGVGPARCQMLSRLGVSTLKDLLYLLPSRYIDFSLLANVRTLQPGLHCTLAGKVGAVKSRRVSARRLLIWEAELICPTGVVSLVWFYHSGRRVPPPVSSGSEIAAAGVVKSNQRGLCLVRPEIELMTRKPAQGRIWPVYPLTKGLTQKMLRQWIRCVQPVISDIPDPLPAHLLTKRGLPTLAQTLYDLHEPPSLQAVENARRRLAYEEAFTLSIAINWQKLNRSNSVSTYKCAADGQRLAALRKALPYSLTDSQQQAVTTISSDMESGQVMARLLHGDVGSGKTVVAMFAAVKAVENGYQAVIMVPTRILAEQHYNRWYSLLSKVNVKAALLTSGNIGKNDDVTQADIIIGTHALLYKNWPRLGLVVIDEQHRFGVEQRAKLAATGNPHCLYLTATPIPRSVALLTCGDLDFTVLIKEPAKQKIVDTRWILPEKRHDVYAFVRKQVAAGHQAFIVFPHIGEDEDIDEEWPLSVVAAYEQLKKGPLHDTRMGLCHGGLSNLQQEKVIRQFTNGKLQVLVATTVIEVGFDVPNATVMIIEHADCFGLAQLHQLRGRVGRGTAQSYCLLIAKPRTREAVQRLQVIRNNSDGFVLAEQDLKLRGPGELLGLRQSGFSQLKYLEFPQHEVLLKTAIADARTMNNDHQTLRCWGRE